MGAQQLENLGTLLFALFHLTTILMAVIIGHKIGKREGQRLEVRTMIELLDAIKIDSCDQRVFRDRFKSALQWVLDGKKKRERHEEEEI